MHERVRNYSDMRFSLTEDLTKGCVVCIDRKCNSNLLSPDVAMGYHDRQHGSCVHRLRRLIDLTSLGLGTRQHDTIGYAR